MRIDGVLVDGFEITGYLNRQQREIITAGSATFLRDFQRDLRQSEDEAQLNRRVRKKEINRGNLPDFREESRHIREDKSWKAATIPHDMGRRWVELTLPVSDRYMVVKGANTPNLNVEFLCSEDADPIAFNYKVNGQINARDLVAGTITASKKGKEIGLEKEPPHIAYRPRGLHLPEKHVLVDGKPMSGFLFDFGLYMYHNARKLLEKGRTPSFYFPKFENARDSRFGNEAVAWAQNRLDIPYGTVRVTQLIETLTAAFETHEMLWELKDHSAGLNFGRWDYLFSFIKTISEHPQFILPFKHELTMDKDFLRSVAELIVQTCHERETFAMGGMSNLIPSGTEGLDRIAFEGVRADKVREALQGFDGAWVANPALVDIVMKVFEEILEGRDNQIDKRLDVKVKRENILSSPIVINQIKKEHLSHNIRDFILYMEPWLRDIAAVPIKDRKTLLKKMEDLATAQISYAQLFQWNKHNVLLEGGERVSMDLISDLIEKELEDIRQDPEVGDDNYVKGQYTLAADILEEMVDRSKFVDFIPDIAYQYVEKHNSKPPETKAEFIARLEKDWAKNPRWAGLRRNYTAEDIWNLRGANPQEYSFANKQAKKLWNLLNERSVTTMGVISGHEAAQLASLGFPALYIGGWYTSANKNADGETYSDLNLYNSSSVPRVVREVNNVLLQIDRNFHLKGDDSIDWVIPMLADGDTGFGNEAHVGAHMKRMIDAGAAGVHFEDQLSEEKRCGHLADKTLIPTKQFVSKLQAASKMRDALGTETLIVARTDAESARYITSAIDDDDKQFIDFDKGNNGKGKGYYHLKENIGLDLAISRGRAYAEYADLIWFESSYPDIEQAEKFAAAIHEKYPGKMLAYNLSPSFNWDEYLTNKVLGELKLTKNDLNDAATKERVDTEVIRQAEEFTQRLAKAGYVFQFNTYGLFKIQNLAVFEYAKDYKEHGQAAWVRFERKERGFEKLGFLARKPQEWVGGKFWERLSGDNVVTGSTEGQFCDSTPSAQPH